MGSISTWGGGSPSKSTLKSYVHDAAELEFSLFRLQESRKKLKEKLDEAKRENPLNHVGSPNYESEIRPTKNLISYRTPTAEGEQEALQKYRSDNIYSYWGGGQGGCLTGFSFRAYFLSALYGGLVIAAASLLAFLIQMATANSQAGQVISSIVLIGGIIVGCIVGGKKGQAKIKESRNAKIDEIPIKQYHDEIQRHNDEARRQNAAEERRYATECARANSLNPAIRERNAQKRQVYEAKCAEAKAIHNRKITLLQNQLSELDSAITRTTQDRERFYSVNIVPVDYRTIQCVFYLDHAFRNDLVDTVRQGIDRYELSEYRTAVLGGIYSIVSKLDQMTGLMRDLGHQLSSIQSEVSFMSNDLYNMAEEQSRKQTEIGNRILEESRLRRKVTEELNETAKRVERAMNI